MSIRILLPDGRSPLSLLLELSHLVFVPPGFSHSLYDPLLGEPKAIHMKDLDIHVHLSCGTKICQIGVHLKDRPLSWSFIKNIEKANNK